MRPALVALALCACRPSTPPSTPEPSLAWTSEGPLARDLDALAARTKFTGTILVGRGDELRYFKATGPGFLPSDRWRWASVTKQMTAVLVMQEVARGTIDLQASVATYLPTFGSANAQAATIEQLLRHRSGLPNPDSGDGTVPALFQPTQDLAPMTYCAGPVTGPPGGQWTYNNCDYIVLGAILEQVTGRPYAELFSDRIGKPTGTHATLTADADVVGYVSGAREPAYAYARFGASAALVGTIPDLWTIDRALLSGSLLAPAQRETLWDGKPELGFMALGQWVYPLSLCDQPATIVERRGGIGGIGVRNFIVPELDLVVIAMTNRAEVEAAFGEPWSSAGLGYELLSVAAECPAP